MFYDKEELSSASMIVKIAHQHLECYCPTVTVSFLNCYSLTSPQICNYIWSYRTPIQARLVSMESYAMRLHVLLIKKNRDLPLR
jgi:hypothetical protein